MKTMPLSPAAAGDRRVGSIAIVRAAPDRSRSIWRLAVGELRSWGERRRGRAALAALDDRMLRDIGITRIDAWHESRKPFWKK